MQEYDEVVGEEGYAKFVLRHYVNREGNEKTWGLIRFNVRGPGAVVLPLTDAHVVVLERSYRIPMKTYVIELPGGSNDVEGESYEEIAARELREETGYTGGVYTVLSMIPESPGATDQCNMLYMALGVQRTHPRELGADEVIEVLEVPLRGIIQYLRNAKDPVDPKVYAAIALLPGELLHEAIG